MSKPTVGTADAAAAELRELIREAHGATRDLTRLLRECREMKAHLAHEAEAAANQAATDEINRFSRHLQQEMNRHAANLNASVDRAQRHIVKSLSNAKFVTTEDGELAIRFLHGKFNDDVPLPD